MSDEKKSVYFNKMQMEVMAIGANISIVVAGRGTGKGLLQAAYTLRNMQAMPGSTGGLVAPNAIRAKTNIIPSITMHWEAWGYKKGVHWDIGVKPSKKLGWAKPLIEPLDWKNIISFYNGSIIQIISQDRAGTSNSKSFDWLAIDEAKFIDFNQLKNETMQANRGQIREFGDCPWHHGILVTSDMPIGKDGSWFLDYEKKQTEDLVQAIGALVIKIREVKAKMESLEVVPDWMTNQYKRLTALLRDTRRHAVLYRVYSSMTNVEVLGWSFIMQQKRDLPALVFYTSILCVKPGVIQDGFYSSMKTSHIYTAATAKFSFDLEYKSHITFIDCRADTDIDYSHPLSIAFDFNSNINWMVVGQRNEEQHRLNTLKSFWVKYERKLPELVNDFCDYYKYLPLHSVVFYYDTTAIGNDYANTGGGWYTLIIKVLVQRGWQVKPVYIGQPMHHADKHLLINQGFAGRNRLTPFFNKMNNQDLLISITTAGVYNGKKDKRGEKIAETEEDKLESRTDGSDAWDTLYIGNERYPTHGTRYRITSNWR